MIKHSLNFRLILAILSNIVFVVGFAEATTEVHILYTNNTNGALENCLCPGKSYGSLEKRVQFIRDWLNQYPNTLILDSGDFLSATKNTLKDSFAFRAYELIPYDAVGLGDQEFFRGITFLTHLMEESKLPFIATNLIHPIFPGLSKELIVEREGILFGILSIMDSSIFRFYSDKIKKEVKLLSNHDWLQQKIYALKEKVDVVILLSHQGIEMDRQLVTQLKGIDLVVGSHTQTVMESPEITGNTLLVQAGKNGYYVGELTLQFNEDKQITDYEGHLIPMDINLPNDTTVVNMIIEYNRLNRKKVGKRVKRIPTIPDSYIVESSERCSFCHQEPFNHWSRTSHAHAFDSLTRDHKMKSPECLACHTTGFGRDDGYLNYNITASLKNVNCTECHYITRQHLQKPLFNPPKEIREETCIRCHDDENSPNFNFLVYLEKIRHPIQITEREVEVSTSIESQTIHEVQAGETLWFLAGKYLGKETRWIEIFNENRDKIHEPNTIFPGQKLKIPTVERED